MNLHEDYEVAGYRLHGEWYDVEGGASLPTGRDWDAVDLVTINFDPESEDGNYKSVVVGGLDPLDEDDPMWVDDGYTIDDLATELGADYGFTTG